jgi:glycyl-tRNA synthetase beta chain
MVKREDLLVEIGVEELPHSFIPAAAAAFRDRFTGFLRSQKIDFGESMLFSTPRRMALFIRSVAARQEDHLEERKGPSAETAWTPDGKPSRALEGFLKSCSASLSDITVRAVDGREYVFFSREIEGSATSSLLPDILQQTLGAIGFPKNMKWEESGFRFARPIRWIVFIFGLQTVPFTLAGVSSSNHTVGHRSYGGRKLVVKSPGDYEAVLREGSVVADRIRRKRDMEELISGICERHGLRVSGAAQALPDMNTDLTEYPHAVLCEFDRSFLSLPEEVLTSEMVEHQFYFPLDERETGRLSNRFIAISNIEDNEKSRAGYERVLRARLDDGRFFFNEDRKKSFDHYGETLRSVTFHEKLGSMHDKVERVIRLSEKLGEQLRLPAEKVRNVAQTARLCKNDLVTLMVGEFPALQGVMGSYYALEAGYPEEVALGIREHYYPRYSTDQLPTQLEGAVVGIADRLDTVLGIFSIGLKPTGSRDPFALRRKLFGIVRVIISRELNFSMRGLIEDVAALYEREGAAVAFDELYGFFLERIRSIFTELGFAYDEINASLGLALEDIYEAYRRVEALHRYRSRSDFQDMLTSFRRMGNILRESEVHAFSRELLVEPAELDLHRYFSDVQGEIAEGIRTKNYDRVYAILSSFKPYVDRFFDTVLVMDEDPAIRGNRIALLKSIVDVFSDIIDISKIVSS